MKKNLDPRDVAFMQFFRDNYGVKFVDCETDEDLLDDSEDNSAN